MREKDAVRIIVHVDMDAFFASVEQLDNPAYRNRPVVVGADPLGGRGRGVVSASSYEARVYGIHSAMPISQAYRRCPDAVYLRPRFKRYSELSTRIMGVLGEFSPLVEQISIDEAFLDCSGTLRLFGTRENLGMDIKKRLIGRTGLGASVGIAGNKSVAKIASDLEKPDGLTVVPENGDRAFIAPLPIGRLWGVGRKTLALLTSAGFVRVEDVANAPEERLVRLLGRYGHKLRELANGVDTRPVTPGSGDRKSISEETTFSEDMWDREAIEHVLFGIADRLSRKMRYLGIRGRTVTLKIRLEGFETHTKSRTLQRATNSLKLIRSTAIELFRSLERSKRVRLVGIGVSNLGESPVQPGLFEKTATEEEGRVEKVLDSMKKKYGEKVTRAAFLPNRER